MEQKFTKNVTAYIQILPNLNECWENIKILDDKKTIFVRSLQDFGKGKYNVTPNYWVYKTDGILLSIKPEEFFTVYIKKSLQKAIMGTDELIFAYGQTGTGKSSTINGLQDNFEVRGVIPRIIEELFILKENYKYESNIKFYTSYVEINKNYVLDLFTTDSNKIVHKPYKNIQINKMKSVTDGFRHLFQGEVQRNTCFNEHISNIYTSVFTIHITNVSRLKSNPIAKNSKIHIIDMAGIDTGGNTSCQMKNAREVGYANLNKSQLEQCLMAIHIDVVKSKSSILDAGPLVDYLGKNLKAQSIIKFIGHIRTTREDLPVTLSTLRFANIARRIKSAKLEQYNDQSPNLMIEKLQSELDILKQQVDLNSMLMNDDLSYNITQSRIQQMENAVEDYIKSKSNNLVLFNVTDAKIAVSIFKQVCTKLAEEIVEVRKQIPSETKMSVKSSSKGSVPSDQNIEQKVPRASKTIRSRESQVSAKKRRSTDKSSRMSKLSVHSKNKISATGSLTKSGITIGQLMSYDYEGDVTKSLKLKTKTGLQPSIDKISEEVSERSLSKSLSKSLSNKSARLSELNLQTELGDDFQEAWNNYRADENYKFEKLNNSLIYLEQTTKSLLREFNVLLDKLQDNVQNIDIKKNDLLKIQIFKASNLQCGSPEALKFNDSQEQIAMRVLDLINDTITLKEQLLKMQSEMKINIDEYHRLKDNIMKDFTDYCTATYNIKMPATEQIFECIEDKINYYSEVKTIESKDSVNYQQNAYYKYQREMKRVMQKRIDEHKAKQSKI